MLPPLPNPYATPVDYADLAQVVPALAPFLRPARDGRQTIDFRDDAAVRALNAALLKRDFDLALDLPEDRLCPAVPSRLEYVLFVLHLALATLNDMKPSSSARALVGLDVGTGASAIYPLLAMRTIEPAAAPRSPDTLGPATSLSMHATDIDSHSLDSARNNIRANDMLEGVSLYQVEPDGPLFPPSVVDSAGVIDFTMCNPPFYSSQSEIDSSLAAKEIEPFAKCTGAENEMITPGGEVAFVSRMVEESLTLGRSKIRWFTSLLGKHSSLSPLVDLLKAKQIFNYHVHALPPHGHTVRWVLAWSLRDRRFPFELLSQTAASTAPPSSPPSSSSSTPRFVIARLASPAISSITYFTPGLGPDPAERLQRVGDALEGVLRELDGGAVVAPAGEAVDGRDGGRAPKRRRIEGREEERSRGNGEAAAASALEWRWEPPASAPSSPRVGDGEEGRSGHAELVVRAWRNVWSRKARRAAATAAAVAAAPSSPQRPLLELRLLVDLEPAPSAQVRLTAHWVRGLDVDRAAFTGLVGFVTRKVGERLKGEEEADGGTGQGGEVGRTDEEGVR
ncbi:hypothetical protein JCM3775_005531 [Rhodotorula graminis]